jgi:hypothetical protein
MGAKAEADAAQAARRARLLRIPILERGRPFGTNNKDGLECDEFVQH